MMLRIIYYSVIREEVSLMSTKKKIIMTGGGTAGHVTPNIALMPALQETGYEITYIGSYNLFREAAPLF